MENSNINMNNSSVQNEETVRIGDLLRRCLEKWYWFVVCLVVCLAVGVLVILRTTPAYRTSAEIQIKSDSKGASLPSDVGGFGDMGLFTVKSKVNNELRAFESPDLMGEVVSRLRLYTEYTTDGLFHSTVLYGTSLPFTAEFMDVEENVGAGLSARVSGDGIITLGDFVLKGEKVAGKPVTGALGDTLVTPVGRIVVASASLEASVPEGNVTVRKSGVKGVTQAYLGRLEVGLSDKNADVISLAIRDVSTQRAQDVLNTLIAVYNENWVRDKNQIANSTSVFINDRLRVIEGELAGVDSDISAYKSENMIPDVGAAATMYMQQSTVLSQQLQDVSNQLYMARYIKDYLGDAANRNQPIPANVGLNSQNIEGAISDYNAKLIQRNNLVAASWEGNVLVRDLDQALSTMRAAILRSVDNEILALNTRYDNLQGTARQNTARIAANPNQAKRLLSVERQQTVKQALYLFLLQKREENELSQAFTAYNTRIIKHPISGVTPVAPLSSRILLVAILLGLAIPAGVIYLRVVSDTRLRGRSDLRGLAAPFAGEIPMAGDGKRHRRLKPSSQGIGTTIVVRRGGRDSVNEAFRMLRTNLEFLRTDPGRNVVAVTSFNPGSGKTFVSANLAACVAVKGRRVLVVDADLRRGSLSSLAGNPGTGLSNYLAGQTDDLRSVITQAADCPGLDILPSGTVPPNPAELIAGDRFAALLAELRRGYDLVVIDCPPAGIVTDARIIGSKADTTLFILRSGLLERSLLPDIDAIYRSGEYGQLCCVLNGTDRRNGYYGHYGHYGSKAGSYYTTDSVM